MLTRCCGCSADSNGMNPMMGMRPNMPMQPMMRPPQMNQQQMMAPQMNQVPGPIQKQLLGEKLYPMVAKYQPELAGKITGMMLEMDNNELMRLLESKTQWQWRSR
eukprot:Skav211614  [mRNA]  locus=scaffold3083:300189:304314:- [translate_table: standard]